jgi:integrase
MPTQPRLGCARRNAATGGSFSKIKYLNREQARAFLDHFVGNRHEALYALAITTGMRQGELLALSGPTSRSAPVNYHYPIPPSHQAQL